MFKKDLAYQGMQECWFQSYNSHTPILHFLKHFDTVWESSEKVYFGTFYQLS